MPLTLEEIAKSFIPDEYGDCEIKRSQKKYRRQNLIKAIEKWHEENKRKDRGVSNIDSKDVLL